MGIDFEFADKKAAGVIKKRDQEKKEGKERNSRSVFSRNPFYENPFSDCCSNLDDEESHNNG